MTRSKLAKARISPDDFRLAVTLIPKVSAAELVAALAPLKPAVAKELATLLNEAVREYVTARLSEQGIAGITKAQGRGRYAGIMKTRRARHLGDPHMRDLIEHCLDAYSKARGGAPLVNADGGPTVCFVEALLGCYAGKISPDLKRLSPGLSARLRPTSNAIRARILSSAMYAATRR